MLFKDKDCGQPFISEADKSYKGCLQGMDELGLSVVQAFGAAVLYYVSV
jgi:hypothetical protein